MFNEARSNMVGRPEIASYVEDLAKELMENGVSGALSKRLKAEESRRVNLYNEEALKEIGEKISSWLERRLSEEDRRSFKKAPYLLLGSKERIPRPLISTPLDLKDIDYVRDIGFPGEPPFVRGIHPNMYRGKKFTIRPIVGFGTPEDTNKRIHFLLRHGATGINIVFDLPTIQEYDSDHPYAKGQVGLCGVAIDTVEDMKALFKNVPLNEISISLTTHYPSNTMILGSMFLVAAEEMGYKWEDLRGTVQNDPIMEAVVRTSPESLPPRAIFKIHVDNIEFLRSKVPKWNYVTYNGYNLREAGVDEIVEIAVAFSTALEASLEMMRRGHRPDDFLDRMAFFWGIGNDFFLEIARMRAARRLWYRITRYILGASKERSWWCRFHVQTSGISLTREEPLNNIARATLHTLAGVLGGAQSIHASAYDEAYSIPTEAAHLVSLRIQQIIQEETGITDVVDPLAGSFYVEWLTNEVEKEVVGEMDSIWKIGGIINAIEEGWLHRKIAEFAYREQVMLEQGVIKVVGVNVYKADKTLTPPIDVFRYPEDAEERQRRKLETIRSLRSKERVENSLARIVEAAARGENLFPYVIDAVRERATEGEIFNIFKKIYGIWRPRISI